MTLDELNSGYDWTRLPWKGLTTAALARLDTSASLRFASLFAKVTASEYHATRTRAFEAWSDISGVTAGA